MVKLFYRIFQSLHYAKDSYHESHTASIVWRLSQI